MLAQQNHVLIKIGIVDIISALQAYLEFWGCFECCFDLFNKTLDI
jgi:hypothetical protein